MQQYIHPDQVLMTWNSLKLQISDFNKIVVIPVETFVDWGPDDRAQVALYMSMEMSQDNICFAINLNVSDKVYLGALADFKASGILLFKSLKYYKLPIMHIQPQQIAASMATLPTMPAPTLDMNPAEHLATQQDGLDAGQGESTPAQGTGAVLPMSRPRPPPFGVRRPRTSWNLFWSAKRAEIRKEGSVVSTAELYCVAFNLGDDNGPAAHQIIREWKARSPQESNLGRNSQNRNRLTSTPEFQVTASDKCHPTTDEEDVDPVESSIYDSFMSGMNSP
ncbi:hypothetical protein MGN70_010200 [Eutypa lata]|nr:hypothetical protein MGN70_010200 [Eutypa lata]